MALPCASFTAERLVLQAVAASLQPATGVAPRGSESLGVNSMGVLGSSSGPSGRPTSEGSSKHEAAGSDQVADSGVAAEDSGDEDFGESCGDMLRQCKAATAGGDYDTAERLIAKLWDLDSAKGKGHARGKGMPRGKGKSKSKAKTGGKTKDKGKGKGCDECVQHAT